jgi:hypothetical protein
VSLSVPSYPSPFATAPLEGAYGWIGFLAVDFASGTGRLVVNVHPSGADALAGKPPIDQPGITLGQDGFPDLATVLADNAEHFGAIRQYLFDRLKDLPAFAGATDVP